MSGIPLREGRAQALPQLVNASLSYQHHGQMTGGWSRNRANAR
jgi:hypothetical protein